ncbi:MAG: HAMP domain-containing protein [Rhodoferax sp.]|nr:HAMP domain-containing protein [Rhodoferax sp.]
MQTTSSQPQDAARHRRSLSLRQTLLLGAGLAILLPALMLAYFQIVSRLDDQINLRVRAPMQQYADVLSRGVAVAIWNVDRGVATELVDAVMRNPDVVSVTVTDEYKEVFVRKQVVPLPEGQILKEERDVIYNGSRVGRLVVELTAGRIQREFMIDLYKLAASLVAQVSISFAVIWWLFDRRMMRPLRSLQRGALQLARGELDQPIAMERNDEIGELAVSMESMRTDLAKLIAERDAKTAALQNELAERLRAEQALGLSQAKFAAIFDASPVALSVSRRGKEITLLDVNKAWVKLFGRERADVLGASGEAINLYRSTDDRTRLLTMLQAQHDVSGFVTTMQSNDGKTDILCEISGRVITIDDEALLILAWEDITAKAKYEENILQLNASLEKRVDERTRELSGALESLTAAQSELVRTEKLSALGSLVAGIAHELNTPIGNSLTVASTLQDQTADFGEHMAKGLTKSRLEQFVNNIREGATILMSGLRQAAELVSSFKQVAVDQSSVNRRVFRLSDTVHEILLTLGPGLRKTRHAVHSNVPAEVFLESYPGPFGQVLTNLINNAVLHAFGEDQAGNIYLEASPMDEAWIQFTVRDDGRGIPPANIARVFDPFFTTKLGQGGSGLGLNIVYNLVTKTLGGSIRVDSPPGKGACFTLRLPRIAPASDA